jgi:lysophospholipid acyltransferase (LPLAT)-like uncharacterized protein
LSENNLVDFQSAESRRNARSDRRMTPLRRLYYFVGTPILQGILKLVTATYRVETIIGAENIEPYLDGKAVCAPVYWHQHHILCSSLVKRWIKHGFKACFLVSGSVDGEVPERVARAWGAEVIRGSANQSGALALRDMQNMMKRGYSIITTADGPQGPKYEIKSGFLVMARVGNVPILPISCAAASSRELNRWDDFMIPLPFSRVVLAIGEPYTIPPGTSLNELEPHRLNVQEAVMSLMRQSEDRLKSS